MSDLGFMIDDVQKLGAQRLRANQQSKIKNQEFRLGVTLIELLIAIAIIATLSALFLGASRAAMESARSARTKTTISKLHTLIMEHWASYETRRVDIRPDLQSLVNGMPEVTAEDQRMKSGATHDLRLLALRELMKFEMPDRWSDIDLSVNPTGRPDTRDQAAVFLARVPTVTRTYYRRFLKAEAAATQKGDIDLLARNQSAECLYLTVMLITGDGEARTIFTAQDIGDTDGDGAPEFLDGWGNPISWVRWPAGFVGRSMVMTQDPDNPLVGHPVTDHDPFDPFGRNSYTALPESSVYASSNPFNVRIFVEHLRGEHAGMLTFGFRLVPLIFSSGPDGIADIDIDAGGEADTASNPNGSIALDPYAVESDGTYQLGTPEDGNEDGDDNSIDNIHNHSQDNR